MTAEILAATEHLVLRRMTGDDDAALAAIRPTRRMAPDRHRDQPDGSSATSRSASMAMISKVRFTETEVARPEAVDDDAEPTPEAIAQPAA